MSKEYQSNLSLSRQESEGSDLTHQIYYAIKQEILEYCKKHIAKYAMPYDIEFRSELPKTLVGKVAYRVLEEEANEQLSQQNPS